MIPQRFAPSQSSAVRKSRLADARPSMLPKPRRPGSTDRLSVETRRPSTTGHRSSSAEPPRGTFGGGRDASATKLPKNGRSRSQQGVGQSSVTPLKSSQYSSRPTTTPLRSSQYSSRPTTTPLRSSQYSLRPTTTPQRTPSQERRNRSWQISLERALAFLTIKDLRPISTVAWQRAELARVQEALAMRGPNNMVLVRPLTITRFIDIVGALLATITRDTKLNNDNYVAKLPHISKRLLYPAPMSKSWLKTVNTLHAFPQALALIAYLLDLANHIEMPIDVQSFYVEEDELRCLQREYLNNCWNRFQDPTHKFDDLNEEYLQRLQELLGNDEEKIAELNQRIIQYESCLEDETEQAAKAEDARLSERYDALLTALRAERSAQRQTRAETEEEAVKQQDLPQAVKNLDVEIDKANAENQQLKLEVETQSMSVAERTRLLDEVDYALRVHDSKRALVDQIAKMVLSKETELAIWQKKSLDSCMEYKQGLIHLSAQFPHLAALAVDEKELMGLECAQSVSRAVEALRACWGSLQDARASQARTKTALARKRAQLLDETNAKTREMKASIAREQQSLETEASRESSEAATWNLELQEIRQRMEALAVEQRNYARVEQELDYWQRQDQAWRSKLTAMGEYIESKRSESARLLETGIERRKQLVRETIEELQTQLDCCYILN